MKEETRMRVVTESILKTPGGDETSRAEGKGTLRCVGGSCSLSYLEFTEGGKIRTTVTFPREGGTVTVKRSGAVVSEMIFRRGVEHASVYEIPPYRFDMCIRTHAVEVNMDAFGGEISLSYTRVLGEDEAEMTLRITAYAGEVAS